MESLNNINMCFLINFFNVCFRVTGYYSNLTEVQHDKLNAVKSTNAKVARFLSVVSKFQKEDAVELGKPKKPLSAYFLFMKACNKDKSVTQVRFILCVCHSIQLHCC